MVSQPALGPADEWVFPHCKPIWYPNWPRSKLVLKHPDWAVHPLKSRGFPTAQKALIRKSTVIVSQWYSARLTSNSSNSNCDMYWVAILPALAIAWSSVEVEWLPSYTRSWCDSVPYFRRRFRSGIMGSQNRRWVWKRMILATYLTSVWRGRCRCRPIFPWPAMMVDWQLVSQSINHLIFSIWTQTCIHSHCWNSMLSLSFACLSLPSLSLPFSAFSGSIKDVVTIGLPLVTPSLWQLHTRSFCICCHWRGFVPWFRCSVSCSCLLQLPLLPRLYRSMTRLRTSGRANSRMKCCLASYHAGYAELTDSADTADTAYVKGRVPTWISSHSIHRDFRKLNKLTIPVIHPFSIIRRHVDWLAVAVLIT